MQTLQSGEIYTGEMVLHVYETKKMEIQATNEVTISEITKDGEEFPVMKTKHYKGKGIGRIKISCPEGDFFRVIYQDEKATYDPADPIPLETSLEKPELTIVQKMMAMLRSEMENKYGRDSEQIETLEEALDFDIDEDGFIGDTQYTEMVEEVLDDVPPEPSTEPAPPETPPDPVPDPAPE